DRRFSRWKGSVVDSVVGVFLTQNVSDHLSSSAFMALAARFPLWSGCHGSETNTKERDPCIKHVGSCIETLDGNTSKWQGQISDKELHDPSSLVIVGDNETANSNESFGSNISGKVADYSKVYLDSKETVIDVSHESPDTESGTPVTLTGSTGVAEAEDRWSVEDAGSSQNSVVSSQNSSENPAQTADPIGINSLSNIRVENKEEKRQCEVESTKQAVQFQLQEQNSDNQQNFPNLHNNGNPLEVSARVQLDLKDDVYVSKKISAETPKRKSKEKKLKDENERKNHDWDSLRKEVNRDGTKKERIYGTMDSVNWEAVRCAEVNEISETIRERGMNNMLAERIKKYLWPRLCKLDQRTL
ncbi:hypothetical protein B296_00051772, partial [Ensete ventricosum]